MRIWDVGVRLLCYRHLGRRARELHAIWTVHTEDAELARRGFRHASPLNRAACDHGRGDRAIGDPERVTEPSLMRSGTQSICTMTRELSSGHAVCLTGLELPAPTRRRDRAREFEVLWSVEPTVVAVAAEICLGLVRAEHPELAGDRPVPRSMPVSDQQLRLATAITTRAFGRLG